MKNLVLLLLLANLVFFAWNHWVAEPPANGATQFRQSELGPKLDLVEEPSGRPAAETAAEPEPPADEPGPADETASEAAPTAEAPDTDFPEDDPIPPARARQETPPAAAPAAACLSVGPLSTEESGEEILARVRGLGGTAELRSATEEVFLGHWVQIRNIPSREEANRQVAELQEAGFEDAYPMPEDDGERTISLGLFSDEERAERLREQAAELGLAPEVVPQSRETTTWWVDVRLDPAQDADDFAGALGVDSIVTGADAVCPR
jgi:hypothetical protein